jgi:hypothetical protein
MLTGTRVAGQVGLYGLMARFDKPEALLVASRRARDRGYSHMDAYSPMPVEGLAEAVGFRSKAVSYFVFTGGLLGACGGFGLMWWITVIAFPHIVSGRPLNSWPAYIPITFECMVLVACFTAVISMMALNGLPQPYHPVFNVPEFERASRDKFFLCIEASDPKFSVEETRTFLEELGPEEVHEVAP